MTIAAMKLALEALELEASGWFDVPAITRDAITTLRAAIEEAEKQEPRQWQGLTRDERMDIINRLIGQYWVYVVDAIEAKLKEKNG